MLWWLILPSKNPHIPGYIRWGGWMGEWIGGSLKAMKTKAPCGANILTNTLI